MYGTIPYLMYGSQPYIYAQKPPPAGTRRKNLPNREVAAYFAGGTLERLF